MGDSPSPESKEQTTDSPAPEVLKPRADFDTSGNGDTTGTNVTAASHTARRMRRGMYNPSHKATFIGLAVVIVVLAVNAAVFAFIIRRQSSNQDLLNDKVVIDQSALDKLGVNRTAVGNAGIQLVVGPDARFNNKVDVGGAMNIGGQLTLNSKLLASDASLGQLEAANSSFDQLNVNGNGTLTNLTIRNELAVAGQTRLQGAVTVSQLFTVNNNANVTGSLAVGGTLSTNSFQTNSLTISGTLTVGGHITTRGTAPGVTAGPAVGSNGTVSISGNDQSGTVAVNIGVGASAGTLANVTFNSRYGVTPHVVVTAVGGNAGSYYINRSATGFSIVAGGALSPGGYAFDFIVMQ